MGKMRFGVSSRMDVLRMVRFFVDMGETPIVISILDEDDNGLNYHCLSEKDRKYDGFFIRSGGRDYQVPLLSLRFADTEDSMTEKDAEDIASFVEGRPVDCKVIIVQCGAGISRSAGVAAALGKHLNDDDAHFFSGQYRPNMNVYRKVFDALNKEGGQ